MAMGDTTNVTPSDVTTAPPDTFKDSEVSDLDIIYAVIGCMAFVAAVLGLFVYRQEKKLKKKRSWHQFVDEESIHGDRVQDLKPAPIHTHMILHSSSDAKSAQMKTIGEETMSL